MVWYSMVLNIGDSRAILRMDMKQYRDSARVGNLLVEVAGASHAEQLRDIPGVPGESTLGLKNGCAVE